MAFDPANPQKGDTVQLGQRHIVYDGGSSIRVIVPKLVSNSYSLDSVTEQIKQLEKSLAEMVEIRIEILQRLSEEE